MTTSAQASTGSVRAGISEARLPAGARPDKRRAGILVGPAACGRIRSPPKELPKDASKENILRPVHYTGPEHHR